MAVSIDDELKHKIKELPISEVMGRYLTLHRKGPAVRAVCPFHDDHDPSMHINDDKGMWYCFVDQMGGDAIKFVQEYRKLNYVDALKDICDQMGWDFQSFVREKKSSPKIDMGKKILTKTTTLYRKVAGTGNFQGYNDFIKNRGLDEEIASTYTLGFAPPGSALTDYLLSIKEEKDRNFAVSVAEELGLIRKSQYGEKSHYDTFRERVIFPIWDQFGQVIGFTSRSVRDDQKPKYLNSIDSFLFNKRNLLYGLHLAKNAIREKDSLIICEGNMDQVALYKNGFQNSVAIMGVALGDNSLNKVLLSTKIVYLMLDNDAAGWKAGTRINAQFMEKGVTPYYVDLSPHKDPDDFLIEEGALALQERIDKAKPFIDVEIEQSFPKEVPNLAERQLELLQSFFQMLSPLKDSLSATERVATLARRIGLQSDPATIIRNYESFLSGVKKPTQPKPTPQPQVEMQAPSMDEPPMPDENFMPMEEDFDSLPEAEIKLSKTDRTLMQSLVQHPELLVAPEMPELLDFVGNSEVKSFILRLKELWYEIDESEYMSVVQNLLSDDHYSSDLSSAAGAAIFRYRESKLNEKVASKMVGDIKRRLEEDLLKMQKEEIKNRQRLAKTADEQNELLAELLEVDKKLINIRKSNTPGKRTTT